MLFQVGGHGTRPTFLEMATAQQLPSSLRAALTHLAYVLALRRPFIHKILDYEEEFFALLMLVLETHSLRTTGYITLPEIKSPKIYNKEREAMLQANLWGDIDERLDSADVSSRENNSFVSRINSSDGDNSVSALLLKRLRKTVAACYPWLHAGNEGLSFAYQLLYLLDATGFYSLGLPALGVHVCRATGQELMNTSSRVSIIQSRERERLRGSPWVKALQGDDEWWYQSAEERMSAPTVYPPPPPPPPKAAKEGIPLPPDKTLCPLCTQNCVNPSVMAISGFVFCYAFIFKYTDQYKRCQVTLMPGNADQIRRLFQDLRD